MITRDDILTFLKMNKDHFQRDMYISRIGLFGSFSRGDFRSDSDIDLLVEMAPETPDIYAAKKALRDEMQKRFHRNIDIVSAKYIKNYARDEILKETIYA